MSNRDIERRLLRLEQRQSLPGSIQVVLDTPENRSHYAHSAALPKNAQRRSNGLVIFVSEAEWRL